LVVTWLGICKARECSGAGEIQQMVFSLRI
jgi:hypothetical protein